MKRSEGVSGKTIKIGPYSGQEFKSYSNLLCIFRNVSSMRHQVADFAVRKKIVSETQLSFRIIR